MPRPNDGFLQIYQESNVRGAAHCGAWFTPHYRFLPPCTRGGSAGISAITWLDLSTAGKSDFLPPVFTIFPHYCPIFLYIAHYSHSGLLARQLYRGQEIVRTGKNFEKNHSPSHHTTFCIKSLVSLLSFFGFYNSRAKQKQVSACWRFDEIDSGELFLVWLQCPTLYSSHVEDMFVGCPRPHCLWWASGHPHKSKLIPSLPSSPPSCSPPTASWLTPVRLSLFAQAAQRPACPSPLLSSTLLPTLPNIARRTFATAAKHCLTLLPKILSPSNHQRLIVLHHSMASM